MTLLVLTFLCNYLFPQGKFLRCIMGDSEGLHLLELLVFCYIFTKLPSDESISQLPAPHPYRSRIPSVGVLVVVPIVAGQKGQAFIVYTGMLQGDGNNSWLRKGRHQGSSGDLRCMGTSIHPL